MGKDTNRSTKRARTNFTRRQLQAMESVFQEKQYPDVTTLTILSERIGLETEKVCTWFQNRRSKFRKQSKNGHVTWMRTQIYSGEQAERNITPSPTDVATSVSSVLAPATTAQQSMYNYPSYPSYYGHHYYSPYAMRQAITTPTYTASYAHSGDVTTQTCFQPMSYTDFLNSAPLTNTSLSTDFLLDYLPSDWTTVMGQSSPLSTCMYSSASATGAH